MPQARQMQRRGGDVPQRPRRRLAVLPLARVDLHRPAAAPDRGAHQHPADDAVDPIGGYRAFARNGNPAAVLQRAAARERLHDRLHRQVHERLRDVDQLPGPAPRPGEGAGVERVRRRPRRRLPRVGLLEHPPGQDDGHDEAARTTPKPPRDSSVAELDQHYATNVMSRPRAGLPARHRDARKPYFLEVATYGPHAQMHHAYPDNPTFPSAFADRAPAGRPGRRQLRDRGRAAELTLRDLPGYDDPRDDNAPTYLRRNGATTPAPAWNTNPITLTDARALHPATATGRGWCSRSTGCSARLRAAAGPNTYVVLTSDNGFHLGQLAAQRRQGHAVRLRHPRARSSSPARAWRRGRVASSSATSTSRRPSSSSPG